MSDTPDPIVPPDVDLNGYGFMPLYGDRLFGSDFNAQCSDAEWRAGVTLWWAAWKQVPAASLPDDDIALARLADLGRDVKAWKKLRLNALRGFVKCSDGRLYHRVIAEVALAVWEKRKAFRDRTEKARAERLRLKLLQEQSQGLSQSLLQRKDASVTVHKGEGEGQDKVNTKPAEPDGSLDPVWGPGLNILLTAGVPESHARSFVGALLGSWESDEVLEALQAASGKADPRGYVRGVLKTKPKKGETAKLRVAL